MIAKGLLGLLVIGLFVIAAIQAGNAIDRRVCLNASIQEFNRLHCEEVVR